MNHVEGAAEHDAAHPAVVELVVNATNRRGKAISCKVVVTPLRGAQPEARGVILLMEEQAAANVH
jgi:hypothetical protein